ncbi:peptidylprolyl isomerase [Trichonephila clavata]|uniref:peptidylprolyl isomerase n=1 Tax=Trichonephila clavata TaxID=2740835 RepID=A0A8X6GTD7_TRICU|nr:peptidylprolyl isomerase [Trichonephila clavata]
MSVSWEVIPDKSVVFVHYDAYLDDQKEPFDSTRLRKKPFKFLLGDGNLIPGLEMGIKTMKKGELSRNNGSSKLCFWLPVEFEEMSLEAQKQASFEKMVWSLPL